jgi:hypothetical protein
MIQKKRFRWLLVPLCSLLFGGGCIGSPDLFQAAQTTYLQYITAVNNGSETSQTDIPQKYWAPRISAQSPVRVYVHRSNVVVVTTETPTQESGLYITLPLSSYLPSSGDDNFNFTPTDPSVYRYTRSKP